MAKREKTIVIDGIRTCVKEDARIIDVVPREVFSVVTQEGALIPRSQFNKIPLPDNFDVCLTEINKGGER